MQTESTHQTLTVLYPLYKEEVYRRREQMMKLTVWGVIGLLAMLFIILLNPSKAQRTTPETWLLGVAALIWSGLICSLIAQQRYRHRSAKQILIQLERTLGFYEEGLFVENHALYPHQWQTEWVGDTSTMLYFACLGVLTGVIVMALLLT